MRGTRALASRRRSSMVVITGMGRVSWIDSSQPMLSSPGWAQAEKSSGRAGKPRLQQRHRVGGRTLAMSREPFAKRIGRVAGAMAQQHILLLRHRGHAEQRLQGAGG